MARRLPTVLFGTATIASGALLLSYATRLTFLGDSWELLVRRSELSAGTLLDPFHEHLILAPAAIYELLLATFGMDSALPFFVVSIGLFLTGVALLYAYLRRRVGDWLALAACLPVLFLGAASEDLLWEFQMTFFGSVAAGLGMLLALEREDRRGDRLACLLLLVSMTFSGVGLAFAAAALADLLRGRGPRSSRAYVALLPLAAYAVWWAIWGSAEGGGGINDPLQLPRDVFDAIAAGLTSLLGRSPAGPDGHPPLLSQLLLVVLGVIAGVRLRRSRPLSRDLVVTLTAAFAFWTLISLDQGLTRDPASSRYQYPSAVFVLLVAGALVARPPRPRPILLAAAAAVSAVSVAGGLSMLRHEYDDFWRPTAEDTRAVLAAADLAGSSPRSGQRLRLPVDAIEFSVGEYARARAKHGSPAYSEAELASRPNRERQFADRTMAEVLALRLAPADGEIDGRCRSLTSGDSTAALPPGRYRLRSPAGSSVLRLGRFADDFPVELADLPAGATRSLSIPADRAKQPWRVKSEGSSTRICG